MAFDFSTSNIASNIRNTAVDTGQAWLNGTTDRINQYVGDSISKTPIIGQVASATGITSKAGVTNTANTDPLDNFTIKLISTTDLRNNNPSQIERVIFDVSPSFNEDRAVEYSPVSPIHMPGSVQVYKRTNARTFSISAYLVSRTREEATKNMAKLQTLRGWTMPYFGVASATGSYGAGTGSDANAPRELMGAPPDVLYLYAYSAPKSRNKGHVNINRVPVVLSQLGIIYPEDVDYIPTFNDNKEPMPTRMQVSLTLLETHSPFEYEQFSLQQFKAGKLAHF